MTATAVGPMVDQLLALWERDRYNPQLVEDRYVGPLVTDLMRAARPVTTWELTRNDDPMPPVPLMRWVGRPQVGWLAWADLPAEAVARQAVPRADVATCDLCGLEMPGSSGWWRVLPVSTGQSIWLFAACFGCNDNLDDRQRDLRWLFHAVATE